MNDALTEWNIEMWKGVMNAASSSLKAQVIDYKGRPGGQCRCCGANPPERYYGVIPRSLIFKASICDADGVYYSMLCGHCLEEIRGENRKREMTVKDECADIAGNMMGDDIDGMEAEIEDFFGDE